MATVCIKGLCLQHPTALKIWDAARMLVWDSGSQFADIINEAPTLFSSQGDADRIDSRSEKIVSGIVRDSIYAFIGLEPHWRNHVVRRSGIPLPCSLSSTNEMAVNVSPEGLWSLLPAAERPLAVTPLLIVTIMRSAVPSKSTASTKQKIKDKKEHADLETFVCRYFCVGGTNRKRRYYYAFVHTRGRRLIYPPEQSLQVHSNP